ncbi:Inactive LRR receptor-like serine/threonine-protein kinase BIR2 [Zea mays]|uniref:MLO-like protein n=2 Tax=Zea mays TaxID=4577 RepID=A0A1D6ES86_MAIZE|nr:Inactive LRR receptor-like serine/threonine-protein kinase BIR2 [Zea mays]ONM22582.1 Inactive LRR receptor-like serine/threonine-protein kinase BIR2 [Zea mays]ONM22590.1 Inactive LRR receptor-like serine/threonine-protein kinase BIR2 [Zea mays]ONM22591.1 Inactive LRR receptor-like serine/threonine-protein kinase BIR2 [Zea mays]ONM22592.1 Inactive LRR receptor-like serine/threonine-protein kinase BIR2 [Zea mays]
MLLGVISLLLSQTARFISEICVPSSLFTSRFYICSESDYQDLLRNTDANQTALDKNMFGGQRLHVCGEGHEPFVSYEGLEQLHRFLFILGITHVLYSFVTVVLSMIKIYSWRKWETLAGPIAAEELKARRTKVMRRQSTFVFNNASHPWSKNKILIWMLCFLRQFKGSIIRSDYLALRLGFVTYHKLPHSYDFHKYMVRSMEDYYNGTIGISWPLWAYVIVCVLINVHVITNRIAAAQAARRAAPTVLLPRLASRRAMASTKAPGEKHHSIDTQLHQLVPGKVSEDDKLIEYDALLIDRFLNILQDLHGPSLREFVQECYEVSADYEGKGDTTKLGELSAKLMGLAPVDAILVASSILHMLNLANLSEEVQITHRCRNSKLKKGGFADEGSATTESDIEETLKRLVSEVGKSLEEVFEALKNQIDPHLCLCLFYIF